MCLSIWNKTLFLSGRYHTFDGVRSVEEGLDVLMIVSKLGVKDL